MEWKLNYHSVVGEMISLIMEFVVSGKLSEMSVLFIISLMMEDVADRDEKV